ncbi:TonB-dependent receptor [Solimonas soli]|uniref:TonB-dependent receptor n=1 Tax=Solimonas soli TaxID=413479 RepID=UPI0004826D57|nr:TonB-dependent siderophore receptor [Solimonas soli]
MKFRLSPIAVAVLAAHALPAAAQQAAAAPTAAPTAEEPAKEQATQLREVKVQAEMPSEYKAAQSASPKFTEPLRDTPQTLVIIPSQVYTDQAQTSLRDVLRNTPGITIQQGEGGSAPGDNIYIRGFSARNDVYIDGVRDPGVLSRDTFNVEQVEVAKGPASAINGRGSTGGAINIVSKSAQLERFDRADFTYGSADYRRATVDLNQPLSSDSALRLNGMWQDSGVEGRDVVNNKYWGFAPSLALGLGAANTFTFNYEHVEQDNIPDYGLPLSTPGVNGGAASASNPPVSLRDLDWSNFYGLKDRDYEKINSDVGTIIAEHAFNDRFKLRNTTRYGRNDRDAIVTPPRAVTATATGGMNDPGYDPSVPQIRRTDTKYQDRYDEMFANQTNLTIDFATGVVEHSVVAGLEFSREHSVNYSKIDACVAGSGAPVVDPAVCAGGARPPVTSIYDPNPNDPYDPSGIARSGAYSDSTGNSTAAYAFDTLKIGEHWQVSGGLRWERFDVDVDNITLGTTAGTFKSESLGRTDNMTSWRLGVVYKPIEIASVYAAASTSFNPSADGSQGLAASSALNNANNIDLTPEKAKNYEIGTKWDFFDEQLSVTAALFRSQKSDIRTNAVDPTSGTTFTINAGDQRVQGFELSFAGNITREWAVFGGYAYMDSEVQESAVVTELGNELQYTPKQTASLWTTYELPLRITVGAGAQYTGKYEFSNTSLDPAGVNYENQRYVESQTEYWTYNAMASYDVTRQVGLRVNVNNLSDEKYVERGYSGHFTPGAGRTVLATLSLKF